MRPLPLAILTSIAALGTTFAADARAGNDIVIAAPVTSVAVEPRAARLKLVNLPILEFALRAVYRCAGEPVALTLSVADTARSIDRDDLLDRRAAEVTLQVPASQVAMADSGKFCISDDPESADELHVDGFATAAASLRCDDGGVVSVHYSSVPLNVRMTCTRAEDQGAFESSDAER